MTVNILAATLATSLPLWLAQTNMPGQASQSHKDGELVVAVIDYTVPADRALSIQRPLIEIPDGENTWTLKVETGGGFVAEASGRSVTLTSKGRVTMDDSSGACAYDCPGGFPEIDRLIGEANAAGWGDGISPPDGDLRPAPISLCQDCQVKTLVLYGRSANGIAYGHGAYWDDMTFSKLKKEVAAIYSAVEKIKRRCPETRGSDLE